MELEPLDLINKLIEMIVDDKDERHQKKVAWCLELALHDFLPSIKNESYPDLVASLRKCIELMPRKGTKKIALISIGMQDPTLACQKGLWRISESLDFTSFYKAWYSCNVVYFDKLLPRGLSRLFYMVSTCFTSLKNTAMGKLKSFSIFI